MYFLIVDVISRVYNDPLKYRVYLIVGGIVVNRQSIFQIKRMNHSIRL